MIENFVLTPRGYSDNISKSIIYHVNKNPIQLLSPSIHKKYKYINNFIIFIIKSIYIINMHNKIITKLLHNKIKTKTLFDKTTPLTRLPLITYT